MTELTLFASTFVLVFALGAQSLNVNNGHYIAAALTSFVIGGGPFGITASMWAHPRLAKLLRRKV